MKKFMVMVRKGLIFMKSLESTMEQKREIDFNLRMRKSKKYLVVSVPIFFAFLKAVF